jgi:hypothetical protein
MARAGFDEYRRMANSWQSWLAIALILTWIVLYAVTTYRQPEPVRASSGYWPDRGGFAIPYQGSLWSLGAASHAADVSRDQLVLLGVHDGVKFYGRVGNRQGGGGGYAGQTYPQVYVLDSAGHFVQLERTEPEPGRGRFLEQ